MFYGIGFNDRKYPTKVKSKHTREYIFWTGFLSRSCSENTKNNQPSYKPRSVSENFKSYSYFYEWCQDQIGFDLGFDLDKDLIVKGNKIYSEEFCVFLPSEINRALCKNDKGRGGLPIGVFYNKKSKKFESRVRRNSNPVYIGSFDSEIDAFNSYKSEKESYLKHLANKYKGLIDERACKALIDYSVSIHD